jgi:hypothetical protein
MEFAQLAKIMAILLLQTIIIMLLKDHKLKDIMKNNKISLRAFLNCHGFNQEIAQTYSFNKN